MNSKIWLVTLLSFLSIYFIFRPSKSESKFKSTRLRQLVDHQDGKIVQAKLNSPEPQRRPTSNQLNTLDSEKSQPMLNLEEAAGDWLLGLTSGENSKQKRDAFLNQAKLYPLETSDLIAEVLNEIPRDQTELRDHTLAMLIDLGDHVKKQNQTKDAKADEFFNQISAIALAEMKFTEFTSTDMINSMNSEQIDILIHDGFLVQTKDGPKRSTLSNKVMAIKLAQLDTNPKRRADFRFEVETLSQTMVDDFTKQTLHMVLSSSSL